jgi:hypothetical protein
MAMVYNSVCAQCSTDVGYGMHDNLLQQSHKKIHLLTY